MKLVGLFGIGSIVICAACTPSQWQNFKSDPVEYIQALETNVNTYLSIAQSIYNDAMPLLGVQTAQLIKIKFDQSVAAIQHAEVVLNDALKAAADQEKSVDFTKLIADLINDVSDLTGLIDSLKHLTSSTKINSLHMSTHTISTFK